MHMLPGIAMYTNKYFAISSKPGIHTYSALKCGLYDLPFYKKESLATCLEDYGKLRYGVPAEGVEEDPT